MMDFIMLISLIVCATLLLLLINWCDMQIKEEG